MMGMYLVERYCSQGSGTLMTRLYKDDAKSWESIPDPLSCRLAPFQSIISVLLHPKWNRFMCNIHRKRN